MLATSAAQKVGDRVVNTNRATTTPDPFAARVHASYQDFLVPLSAAINTVSESEDGQSFIVRFNPFRQPPWVAGLTVTASKPQLDDRIAANLPADGKDATRLEGELVDLGDVTLSGSVARESRTCDIPGISCWGRNPRTYRNLLAKVMLALYPEALSGDAANTAFLALGELIVPQSFDTKLADLPAARRGAVVAAIDALLAAEASDRLAQLKLSEERGVNALASLIDNQPQLAFSATVRDRQRTAGPGENAATIEFQFGGRNLNALTRSCPTLTAPCLVPFLTTTTPETSGKFVLSASYKEISRYSVTAASLGIDTFTALDIPRGRELAAKLQWGRRLDGMASGQPLRVDVAFEGVRITSGGKSTKNDWVGNATLTIPIAENISVPVSLLYGNRPDLIMSARETWSTHVGISYRLPWELHAR